MWAPSWGCLGLHLCSEKAHFLATCSQIWTWLSAWKSPQLLKSTWRKGCGLRSQWVLLKEIMRIWDRIRCWYFRRGGGLKSGRYVVNRSCVFGGEVFVCGHMFFLSCCLFHNLQWPQALYCAAPCRVITLIWLNQPFSYSRTCLCVASTDTSCIYMEPFYPLMIRMRTRQEFKSLILKPDSAWPKSKLITCC